MATEVSTIEIITLFDGEEVEIRPLPIARLRKFTQIWNDHLRALVARATKAQADDGNDEDMDFDPQADVEAQWDAFIKMCALGLESQCKTPEMTDKKFLEYLEGALDEPTVYKILDVTGGLKFGEDPNQNPASLAATVGNN